MTRKNRSIDGKFHVKSNIRLIRSHKFPPKGRYSSTTPQKPVILRHAAFKNKVKSCKEHAKIYKIGAIHITNTDVSSDLCIPDHSETVIAFHALWSNLLLQLLFASQLYTCQRRLSLLLGPVIMCLSGTYYIHISTLMLFTLNLSVAHNLKHQPVEIFSNFLQKIFITQLYAIFIIYRQVKFHTTRCNQ